MVGIPFATLEGLQVADAMHPGVLTCPPETPLVTVARIMVEHRVHCVVVYGDPVEADVDGRVWGIVSDLDLVTAVGSGRDEPTAGGTAASPVLTVGRDETLERAAQLMTEYSTAHIVVVEPSSDRPIGILSSLDLAGVLARRQPCRRKEPL